MPAIQLQLDLPSLAMKAAVATVNMAVESRVGVMCIILFVSFLAVSFPTISKKVQFLRIPGVIFFIGKHFGTGVILATAFIHLLDDAFRSLQSTAVQERYGKLGHRTGLIVLASLLTIFLVEYISTSYVEHLHDKPSAPPTPISSLPPSRPTTPKPASSSRSIPRTHSATKVSVSLTETTPLLLATKPATQPALALTRGTIEPLTAAHNTHHAHHNYHVHHSHTPIIPAGGVAGLPIEVLTNSPRICRLTVAHEHVGHGGRHTTHRHSHETIHVETDEVHHDENHHPSIGRKRQIVGILVLQLGIMIHSLVIGLTLSVTSGSEFTSLTTAIIFHQLFEGFSLGIRIAALPPNRKHKHKRPHDPEAEVRGRLELRDTINGYSSTINENDITPSPQEAYSESTDPPSLSETGYCGRLNHKHSLPSSKCTSTSPYQINRLRVFDVRRWCVSWSDLREVPWLKPTLTFLFAVTTPFGMGLGMAVWGDKDGGVSDRAQMLLIQGLMSAISAGMLIYAATVEMIAGDFVFGDVEGYHHHHHHHHHHHGHGDAEEQNPRSKASSMAPSGEERIGVEDDSTAGTSGEGALGGKKSLKATTVKKVLAVVSLLAGSTMMVLVGMGE